MNWQIASFLVLVALLAVGFGWYERSRPPAKVLSLVAALAALATVGRIAFAPIPNVKPTTDIALFAGFALGPVPGFAVGAVAALASNVFFGQGPWTPWQMVGWGAAGLLGGLLAKVAGHDAGRWRLAAACALAGALFGMLMDGYQWVQGAEQDLPHYLAVSATSLPYNLAHVIGNIGFCLLLGPTFVRALARYRRRFEVRWLPAAAAALVACAVIAAQPPSSAQAASPSGRAVAYLQAAQNSDGGFGAARGQSSTQLHSGWVALGVAAAGRNPADVSSGGHSVVDFLSSRAGSITQIGDLERTVLALDAAGVSARSVAGRDLVAEVQRRRARNGSWSTNIGWTAFGVLALKGSGVSSGVSGSARWLARQQNRDGGFGFRPHAVSDVDDTGAVLQAMAAGGLRGSKYARRAVRFLQKSQNPDGGFGQMRRQFSNAQSTSWAVQGLVAAGRSPSGVKRSGHSPIAYLRSLQSGDGSIRYSRASSQTPVWVTAQALDALERKAFPLSPPPRATKPRASGGGGGATPAATPKPSRPKARAKKHAAPAHPAAPAGTSTAPVPATAPPAPTAGAAATSRTPISAAAQRAAVREMLHSGGGATEAWAAGALLAGVAVLAAWRLVCRRRSAAI